MTEDNVLDTAIREPSMAAGDDLTARGRPISAEQLAIVPANEASSDDLAAIFGTTDYPGRCQCQRFARDRGARALEAYPMVVQPGKEITWGEVHVGARQVFEDAGFEEISRPTVRRAVMRIDFESAGFGSA